MRTLTLDECREVTGGMRGSLPPGGRFPLPNSNQPEVWSHDANEPVNPSAAQIATCGTLTAGAALMTIPLWTAPPLGPVAAQGAISATNALCNAAFANSRR
ncbi:hypothetical protein GALL_385890 [mine drainage metagenome]|jgi:hypothetical protein|uniref:Uncharacterized protein n=1 Tax=mine drainage metagenome TaxID=410659 RepID=A0A1J5QUV1_9ZZZZ